MCQELINVKSVQLICIHRRELVLVLHVVQELKSTLQMMVVSYVQKIPILQEADHVSIVQQEHLQQDQVLLFVQYVNVDISITLQPKIVKFVE
jgi:hypothetical protein